MPTLKSMSDSEVKTTQILEYLDNGKIRVYDIIGEDSHIGDDDDPLTTIVVKGYKDIQP